MAPQVSRKILGEYSTVLHECSFLLLSRRSLPLGLEHWEEVKKNQKVYIQMWHVLQSEVAEKNDNNKLSAERSRSRSNSGALNIPKDFDLKRRRNSSLAVIDRR